MSLAAWTAVLAAACFLGTHLVARRMIVRAPVDLPDERRIHTRPTPRGGGVGIPFLVAAAAAVIAVVGEPSRQADLVWAVCGFALLNGLLGVADDFHPLRSRWKFAVQCLLATLLVLQVGPVHELAAPPFGSLSLGALAAPLTVLWLVWSTNVFNFMDGLDALAGGSGVLFLLALAALAISSADPALAGVAVCASAALAGFLVLNIPPARVFLGDGGALFVGALLGSLSVLLAREGTPLALPLLAMAPFVGDATYTLLYRIVRREDWLHPHRRHLFQRLVLAGWPPGRVRAVYLAGALASAVAAVLLPRLPAAGQALVWLSLLGAALLLLSAVRAAERRARISSK